MNEFEGNECTCDGKTIKDIQNAIQYELQNSLSLICDSKGVSYAILPKHIKRWANIKVKKCYYLMYMPWFIAYLSINYQLMNHKHILISCILAVACLSSKIG